MTQGHPREFFGSELEHELGLFKTLDFEDVSMRILPLRASQYRLQKFCDDYLNIAREPRPGGEPGPLFAEFRPAGPVVFLMIVHYPKMSPGLSNLGWVAQDEVLFSVPLEGRWRELDEDGEEREVEDFATVSPFIFVDSPMSITTGREIYGWPKYLGKYAAEINPWLNDPRSPRRLMTLKTMSFSRLFEGAPLEEHVFLEIEQQAPQLLSFPPQVDYMVAPFIQIPKLFFDGVMASPDLAQNLARLWGMGDQSPLLEIITSWAQNLSRIPPDLSANTINLKQFRASQPQTAAYQALINAKMHFRKYHGGGMMGSVELLRGDPTGGVTVYLHDDPAFPVIQSLGLEVEQRTRLKGSSVSALKPVLPFWASVDISYDLGKRICWRAEGHDWQLGRPEPKAPPPASAPPTPVEDLAFRRLTSPDASAPTFNTTLGPVVTAVEGPFDFLRTRVRVFPLRVQPPKRKDGKIERKRMIFPGLTSILEQKLKRKVGKEYQFVEIDDEHPESEIDRWAFLVVTSFGKMAAATDAIGWWGRDEVAIGRINKVRVQRKGKWTDLFFMQWPFVFSDSPIAVTEGREVLGLPTAYVEFSRGERAWMEHRAADQNECLLGVRLQDYPALHLGLEQRERTLLEIESVPGTPRASSPVNEFVAKLGKRYAGGLQFSNLSLKQFRDSENPELVCYRALMAVEKGIGSWVGETESSATQPLFGLKPLTPAYEVRICSTASWSIKEDLGLLPTRTVVSKSGARVDVFEAVNPFWLEVDQRSDVPITLISQSIDGDWELGPRAVEYFEWLLAGKKTQ